MADNDDLAELVPPSPVASSTQMSQARVGQPRLPRLPSLDINLDIAGGVSLSPIATDDEDEGQRVISHRGRNRTFARSTGASGSNLRDWVLRFSQEPIHIPSEHGLQAQNDEFVEVVDAEDDDSSRHSSITIVEDSSSDNEVLLVSDSDGEIESRASIANDGDNDVDGDVHDDNDDTLMNRPVEADHAGAQPPVIEESNDAPGPANPPGVVGVVQREGSIPTPGASNVQPALGTSQGTAMEQPGDVAGSIAAIPPAIADIPTGISSTPGPAVRLIAVQGESPAEFRSPKRKRVHSPEHSSAAAAEDKKDEEEEDGDSCPICFEAWTTSGLHRLCSLKCGHLFGQSCIEKWLKGQGGKCPHCNAKAKRHDIRVLYAKSIKALDTSERDRALKDLEKEREVRKKAEMEGAQLRLQYQMAIEENNRLQLELQTLKNQLRRSGGTMEAVASGSRNLTGALGMNQSKIAGQFVLDRTIKICQAGNCRVIAYCAPLAALVASAPSSNPLFPGFGVKMINTLDTGSTQFYTIHSKPIRDLSFHPSVDDGMLLSCSLDKKVKMTSLLSGAVVHTYDTPMAAWSCVWNAENSNLFYAGLQNGEILEFDVRNTEGAVRTLSGDKRSPVASLCYLSQDMSAEFRSGGLLVGQLDRVSFFENLPNHQHRIHILPLEGSLTSLQIEPSTRHILASFRPTGNHPTVRHQLCKLVSRNISADPTVIDNVCSCTVIHTFHGGRTQTVLSRNSVMPHPADHSRLLVCGGDELNKSVHVWDSATGQMSQRLVTGDFTLDLCSYRMNNTTYLAALSDKNCRLFKFT